MGYSVLTSNFMEQILYTLCLLQSLLHLVSELFSSCSSSPCLVSASHRTNQFLLRAPIGMKNSSDVLCHSTDDIFSAVPDLLNIVDDALLQAATEEEILISCALR
jgi:hypothetical protein